jgi:hypothetical protein
MVTISLDAADRDRDRSLARSPAAGQVIKDLPNLKALLDGAQKGQDATIVEARDLDTGKRLGGVVVEGSAGSLVRGYRFSGPDALCRRSEQSHARLFAGYRCAESSDP